MSIVRTIANYADDAVRAIATNGDDVARAAASKGTINLTVSEVRKANGLMREYCSKPTPQLKEQILSIFTPHIEKAAASSGSVGVSAKDYSQNLYLKFFESLDDACGKQKPANVILGKLNNTAPVADDFVSMGHKSIDDLTLMEEVFVTEEGLKSASESVQSLNDRLKQLVDAANWTLTPREAAIMRQYLDGRSLAEIGDDLRLGPERIRQLISKTSKKIKQCNQEGFDSGYSWRGLFDVGLKKGFATEIMNDLY